MISIASPQLGFEEEAAIHRVLLSGQLVQEKNVAAFERSFARVCQVEEAVVVSSGTSALHLALLAHGVGPGDEVITTAFSFAATANVILLVGATPVFVDIEPDTYTLDPALAEAYHVALIEDACQAHAAKIDEKPVGGFGTGLFSFYATKNITTGEGGMVTTNDPKIAERVRLLRSHGQKERYYHTALGYNLRMTEIQGALALVQLEKLERFTERRIANAPFFTERLHESVQTPTERSGYRHAYHQCTIGISQHRDECATHLRNRGIGAAIHYAVPIRYVTIGDGTYHEERKTEQADSIFSLQLINEGAK